MFYTTASGFTEISNKNLHLKQQYLGKLESEIGVQTKINFCVLGFKK